MESRIAEEQARQRTAQQSSPKRSSSQQRASSRKISPSRRHRKEANGTGNPAITGNEPDPSEFEADFVIGDDSDASRVGTPGPGKEDKQVSVPEKPNEDTQTEPSVEASQSTLELQPTQLPHDVRQKLKRLELL